MALSYDLHVHPGPSSVPRWGDGEAVWNAARGAGMRGFVWKSHEEHTSERCAELPERPVRAIGSASLNPWAGLPDITAAIEAGAEWVWGPTTASTGEISWDLPLPKHWDELSAWLRAHRPRVVLATGHLGSHGRAAMARLAAEIGVPCSVTHTLLIGIDEALELARLGSALEIDAYTYLHPPQGHRLADVGEAISEFERSGAVFYFTSDGGQAATGNPVTFADKVLQVLSRRLSPAAIRRLAVEGPAAMVETLDTGRR